jgi:methyltransferase (TIGR00027 family)
VDGTAPTGSPLPDRSDRIDDRMAPVATIRPMGQAAGSRSARLVVLARAHLHWLRVIDDPHAARFLPATGRAAAAALRVPGTGRLGRNPTFAYLAGRTLFYDAYVNAALDDDVRQVVTFGAGYDSRPWRLARPDARFFEVDLPETQAHKRALAPSGGPTYVAGDVTDSTLLSQLVTAGLRADEPTAFILEGLTMYLTEDDVRRLLGSLADLGAPSGRLAANFGVGFESQGSRRGRIGRQVMAAGGEELRFRLAPADAPSFLAVTGWEMTTCSTGAELRDRYLRRTCLADAKVATAGFAIEARTLTR